MLLLNADFPNRGFQLSTPPVEHFRAQSIRRGRRLLVTTTIGPNLPERAYPNRNGAEGRGDSNHHSDFVRRPTAVMDPEQYERRRHGRQQHDDQRHPL